MLFSLVPLKSTKFFFEAELMLKNYLDSIVSYRKR